MRSPRSCPRCNGSSSPTVLEVGSAAQREWLLPAAADGSITACIAYTEADAGSDLANIATSAADDARADRYVLDGEKVLVTGAHKADWCCTIARTDPESHGSRGLSMFLVDMQEYDIQLDRKSVV